MWVSFLALCVFGPGYGGGQSTRVAIQREYYGRRHWGVIQGVLMSLVVVPEIVSPIFAGWIFDTRNSYRPAFSVYVAVLVAAIALILLAKPPQVRERSLDRA